MNNAPAIFRSLIIYAICVPLAIVVGYLLANPLDYSTFAYAGVLGLVLVFPLLIRWHYLLLVFSVNTGMYVFFLKGNPAFWLVMVVVSLGISLLDRAMNSQKHFIRVPQMTWPLICMLGVVFMTAKLNGGIGLHAFGSEVYGGKKYVLLGMGILSYFAFTAQRIPPERVNLYVALLLLGGILKLIGDFYPITPSFLHFIFLLFPPNNVSNEVFEMGRTRMIGVASAALAFIYWLMAKYGLRGIVLSNKLWRPVAFAVASMMILMGGFRLLIIAYLVVCGLLFFMDGLHRTRALLVVTLVGMLGVVSIIPLAPKLPYTFQRTLAFLPLNLSLEARASAQSSSEWRVNLWKSLLPQVPSHLLLGKGYAITAEDFQSMGQDTAFHAMDPSQEGLSLSGDYHNGPLSVVIPFGIWGVIVTLWFMFAGLRVIYCNFRHGDGSLRTINTFLWVYYIFCSFRFLFLFGGLTSDMIILASTIGFSIALNGGVCRPAPQAVQARRPMAHPGKVLPRVRPAFQR